MRLKYGNDEIDFILNPNNFVGIIDIKKTNKVKNPKNKLYSLLKKPTVGEPLAHLIKKQKAKKILIIVNDITRPTPYHIILPPLLDEIKKTGIKNNDQIIFMIATGAHRGHSEEENKKIFGEQIATRYQFINHSCDDANLVDFGNMQSGNRLLVNPIVKQVDFIITTGVIVPHYIAGFSGGRKSILPGICGRETIENNHSNMLHPKAVTGNLIKNPVHEEMMVAAKIVGVDFNINVITDEDYNIVGIVTGDIEGSWKEGIKICRNAYFSTITKKADVVIASAGGYPKDINIYQSQKALENASQAVKPGGTIVLIAECIEGIGNTICEKWIEEANSIQDIENRLKHRFILGGHKAYAISKVAKEVEILLISSLNEEMVKKLFMKPMKNINLAIEYIQKKHGSNFKSYILPYGSITFPSLDKKSNI